MIANVINPILQVMVVQLLYGQGLQDLNTCHVDHMPPTQHAALHCAAQPPLPPTTLCPVGKPCCAALLPPHGTGSPSLTGAGARRGRWRREGEPRDSCSSSRRANGVVAPVPGAEGLQVNPWQSASGSWASSWIALLSVI